MNPAMNDVHVKQELQQRVPATEVKLSAEEEVQKELLARDIRLRVWFVVLCYVDPIH